MRTGIFEGSPVDAVLQQAAAHFRAGRLVQAEQLYRQTLVLRPGLADAHASLAATLFLQGKAGEAIGAFRKALEIAPDDTATLYKLGNLLLREGNDPDRIAESFACFQRHAKLTFPVAPQDDAGHR